MSYTNIDKPTDYFNTKLYTGNGGTQSITGVGFQPDWVWIKKRSGTDSHYIHDALRGAGKSIFTNNTDAETDFGTSGNGASLTAFNSDGFSLGNNGGMNGNSTTLVAWNWKAGTTGSGTTGGSGTNKAYSYSVSTTAGFSIIAYVGNGTDNHQVPHHLGAIPKMFIMKNRSRDSRGWNVYHHTQTASKGALLNTTDAYGGDGSMLNNVEPTSVYVNLGDSSETNKNDDNHIMYAFAEKKGYSKFGSYVGNNNADGNFIYLGFKPSFFLAKNSTESGYSWEIFDNKRNSPDGVGNIIKNRLFPDSSASEGINSGGYIDFVSNGVKIRKAGDTNSNNTYIYMAFAENPFVTSSGVPATAR